MNKIFVLFLLSVLVTICSCADGNIVIGNGNNVSGNGNLIDRSDQNIVQGNSNQITEGFRNKILGDLNRLFRTNNLDVNGNYYNLVGSVNQ